MGEMAEMHEEYDIDDDRVTHAEIREIDWVTKNGTVVMIKDMTDMHLLNAYKATTDENLFAEMVVRLFEAFTKPKLEL